MSALRRWIIALLLAAALGLAGLLGALHSSTVAAWLIRGFLPAGVDIGRIEGSVAGGLRFDSVSAPGITLRRLELRVAIWRSLLGTPTLGGLDAEGIRVDPSGFPAAEAGGDEAIRWPEQSPRFALGPVELRDVEIVLATPNPPLRIDRASWISLQSRGDALVVERFDLQGPELSAKLSGRLAWSSASDLMAELRYQDLDLGLTLTGSPADGLTLDLGARSPLDARVHGTVTGLPGLPGLDLAIDLPSNDLQAPGLEALRGLAPLGAALRLRGPLPSWQLDGRLSLQGQPLQLDGSRFEYRGERLRVAPLKIALQESRLEVEGDWPLSAGQADGALRFVGERLAWPSLPVTLDQLAAELSGQPDALRFGVEAGLRQDQRLLPVSLAGQLGAGVLELERIVVASGGGALEGRLRQELATGELEAEVTLEALDLAVLLPGHPTRLDGSLSVQRGAEGWQLEVPTLRGTWRELPLTMEGSARWSGSGLPVGRLDAELDGSRLSLKPTPAGHDAVLRLGRLQGFLPGAEATGLIELRQAGEQVDWRIDLASLRLPEASGGVALRALRGEGRQAFDGQRTLQAQLQLEALSLGETGYGPLRLRIEGNESAHRLQVEADTPQGAVNLEATGGLARPEAGPVWTGQLTALSVLPAGLTAPGFALEAATSLRVAAEAWSLGRGCLRRQDAELCLAAELATKGNAPGRVQFEWSALDLAQLPVPADSGWSTSGVLGGRAALSFAGPQLQAIEAEVASELLELSLSDEERVKTLSLESIRMTASGALGELEVGLEARLRDGGPIRARARGVGSDALAAELTVELDSLQWLDGLHPELVAPQGRLVGQITLAGQSEQLAFGGALQLADFAAELPGAGLKLKGGELRLAMEEAGRLSVAGKLGTGEGELQIEATAQLDDAGQPQLSASLRGERVLVADLPNVRLLASPNLRLVTRAGVLRTTGTLGLPEGRIDLERFEPAVTASADVVVLDRPETRAAPIQTDVRYSLGPALRLKGFGLDAGLSGSVRVRSRPGQAINATGTVDLSGGYRAYGQNLTIDRGRLIWTNAPIGNPGFDFSAYRTIESLKAGVRVRGSATAPELTVYTDPPREASDALSWLVLGRPLSSASGEDGQQLSAAAGALGSVGGALIGATIGQRLGVEINVESSAELGGSPAFTVGKMLSPRLFVGFGRSLFDSAQLVIVRYRLTERYELEALSGRETRFGANYRYEQ